MLLPDTDSPVDCLGTHLLDDIFYSFQEAPAMRLAMFR